jgi:hypothetical protein
MYIVAIGWMFVVVCMAAVEATTSSFLGAVGTLLFYGLLPLGLFLWLFGAPQRRRNRDNTSPPTSGASFTRRRGGPSQDDQ